MSIFDALKALAENLPKPEHAEPEPYLTCVVCHEHIETGSICGQCAIDQKRGYSVRSLAGRCRNGAERDHGTRFHAVPAESWRALCGAEPGRHSIGWSDYGRNQAVTCPKCAAKLAKAGAL